MRKRKRTMVGALVALLVAGVAIADLANNFAVAIPGRSATQLLNEFASQPNGTIVSIIDGSNGHYVNWKKTGGTWTRVGEGYSPAHDPRNHHGGGSGDSSGGNGTGGTSSPSGPSSTLCPTCTGTVEPGPITKAPT